MFWKKGKNEDFRIVIDAKKIPAKGDLLIAQPGLIEETFNRTVIQLTVFSEEEGAVGFVVNRPTTSKVHDLVPEFPTSNYTVYDGGPVQNDGLYFIHSVGELIPDSIHIRGSLYWSGDFETVEKLVASKSIFPEQIRFYRGYSGWSAGQLESELNENSWYVIDHRHINPLMEPPTMMWKNILLRMEPKYRIWANSPSNPIFN